MCKGERGRVMVLVLGVDDEVKVVMKKRKRIEKMMPGGGIFGENSKTDLELI